jgi:hypothetical protein
MQDDHPTSGDYAYGIAIGNRALLGDLNNRVTAVEDKIEELVVAINRLADHLGISDD